MTEASDLTTLIERLEKAEVGSDELSAYVFQALRAPDGEVQQSPLNGAWCVYSAPGRLVENSSRNGWWRRDGWPVSESLDAALALAERVLPGWDFVVGRTNGGLTIHAQVGPNEMQFGNTPAVALCIAVLKAKEASQ